MSSLGPDTLDPKRRQLLMIRRAILRSRENVLDFARYLRPDPMALWDTTKSLYEVHPHHELIARELEALELGLTNRLIISVPPRHGKSELATNTYIPWFLGRNPTWSTIMATYNSTFAGDFGRKVRSILQDPRYRQIFPDVELDPKSTSAGRMNTTLGGQLTFVGRGGSLTGRGGHLLLVDDPIKDRKEADSGLIRDQLWTWWTQVLSSRAMIDDARFLLIQTRWHEDDLIGRITDPHNPSYNDAEAKKWRVVNLPAIATEEDPLGRKPGEALWPKRFSFTHLASVRDQDNRGFSALYQGEPSPDTGLFFEPSDIVEYQSMKQVPEDVRYFGASDHAISTQQWADKTCLMIFAVDQNEDVWIMPQTNLNKHPSPTQVEIMLNLIKEFKPLFWFAERGHITKSIGPFLRKRMSEERIFTSIYEVQPVGDKQSRAQSIKGRMAAGKVHFPAWAAWYPEARRQILTFPAGAKDDFVDTLSMMGLGLALQHGGKPREKKTVAQPGTFGYLKKNSDAERRREQLRKSVEGW